MEYEYKNEQLYGRAVFSFIKGTQEIIVAFEPNEGDSYMVIIWSEDGNNIEDPHDPIFHTTLNKIFYDFDNGRDLEYDIAAI